MPLDAAAAQALSMLDELGIPAFETMTPAQVRETMSSLRDPSVTGPELADVQDRTVAGVPVRVYTPHGPGPFGVLVWFHGGGWVLGSVADSDVTARELADGGGVVVVSVDYRLAPEHPFPAAVDDCVAVTRWVLDHAGELGGDGARVAVGGDSAGGNLAAVVTQQLRGELAYQLLVYPVTDASMSTPSYTENAEGYLLQRASMAWFYEHYLGGTGASATDARVSPLCATDWTGLPPALVITAEFDPLRDEGESYARRLEDAGVPVALHRYDGQIHGFLSLAAMIPDGRAAMAEAATAVRAALAAAHA